MHKAEKHGSSCTMAPAERKKDTISVKQYAGKDTRYTPYILLIKKSAVKNSSRNSVKQIKPVAINTSCIIYAALIPLFLSAWHSCRQK